MIAVSEEYMNHLLHRFWAFENNFITRVKDKFIFSVALCMKKALIIQYIWK